MVDFYTTHFGFKAHRIEGDRLVELHPADSGASLLLHPAASSQKEGQVLMKLVFDVKDVAKFCKEAKTRGLKFGVEHKADGYTFANCKDPSKNSISVSSRTYRSNRKVQ